MLGAVEQAGLVEQRERAAVALDATHPRPEQRHLDILPGGQVRQQVVQLEDEADDAATVCRGPADVGDVDAVDENAP
jgi:hypothetical protein